jgi:hypothetical protein
MHGNVKGGVRMKRSILGTLLLVLVFTGSAAVMGGQMPMGDLGGEGEKPAGPSMKGMTCPMMGSDMEPMGMMAMMAGGQMDPKAMGRMLELRGEILKAIGDVLVKHGQAMRKEP